MKQVYEAVMRWVDVDSNKRNSDLPLLLENVRLPLISQDYLLQHVKMNALIQESPSCQYIEILEILLPSITLIFISGNDLVMEALNYHLLNPEQKRNYQSPRIRPRCPPKVFQKNTFSFYKTY